MDNTTTPTLPPLSQPRGSEKVWALFSHLSTFVGLPFLLPLIVYLAMKGDSAYAAENAREALNFHLSMLLYALCCIPLTFILIGLPLLCAIGLASLVLAIVAAIKAADGGCYRYPLTIRMV